MLTLLKKIFTWWNQDTFGTRLKTIFFGKLAGTDQFGNKYYEDKKGKRWVIYSDVIDASKIPVEWYSWMHFTPNKIEKKHELEKYEWQKPHQSNLTGTEAIQRMNRSLDEFVIEGITTTIPLHKKLLNHKKFINSDFNVSWLDKDTIV